MVHFCRVWTLIVVVVKMEWMVENSVQFNKQWTSGASVGNRTTLVSEPACQLGNCFRLLLQQQHCYSGSGRCGENTGSLWSCLCSCCLTNRGCCFQKHWVNIPVLGLQHHTSVVFYHKILDAQSLIKRTNMWLQPEPHKGKPSWSYFC